MSRNIYIYYEFYKREFLSNLLLSVIASKKNFNVYIGTDKAFNVLHKKKLISPGIFHTKSLSHGIEKNQFHENLKKNNFIITSIDQEHGVIDKGNFDDLFIKPRIHPDDLNLCSAYFCWGKFDFKKLTGKFKKKIFYLTGSPRVDLWKVKFDRIWKNKNLVKKKYILFVSNFSFPNNFYTFRKIIQRKERENYYRRSPNLKKEEVKYYNYQKQSLKKFTDLIIKFSKKFPEEIIYVRPHPTERVEYWIDNLKNCKNVFIKDKGDLSSYVRNAECVIQDGCTSAMESYISDVPVINYLPVKSNKHAFGQFIKKISINIHDEKNFFQIMKNKKYKILQNKRHLVNERMIFLDKKLSATKIVNVWVKLFKMNKFLKKNEKNFYNKNYKIFFYLFFFDNFKAITTNLILFFKRKMFLKKIFYHKNEQLDIKDINEKVSNLTKSLKTKNNVKVLKLGKNIVCISSGGNN